MPVTCHFSCHLFIHIKPTRTRHFCIFQLHYIFLLDTSFWNRRYTYNKNTGFFPPFFLFPCEFKSNFAINSLSLLISLLLMISFSDKENYRFLIRNLITLKQICIEISYIYMYIHTNTYVHIYIHLKWM